MLDSRARHPLFLCGRVLQQVTADAGVRGKEQKTRGNKGREGEREEREREKVARVVEEGREEEKRESRRLRDCRRRCPAAADDTSTYRVF